MTNKEDCIAFIALHKCGKERVHIFEKLKPLNIKHVFIYHTVKLFLNKEGVVTIKNMADVLFVCHR
jgi:hypothetical protein